MTVVIAITITTTSALLLMTVSDDIELMRKRFIKQQYDHQTWALRTIRAEQEVQGRINLLLTVR
jgi:hypothetical protein